MESILLILRYLSQRGKGDKKIGTHIELVFKQKLYIKTVSLNLIDSSKLFFAHKNPFKRLSTNIVFIFCVSVNVYEFKDP